jgi:hypothetical protein
MTLILQGTDNSVSSPAVQGGTAGATTGIYYPATNQVALASNGTLALLVDGSQNISLGSGVTINAYQGTSPSNGLYMGTVGSAGFFLANQTSTNTNLYLSKASGYTDASLLTTYVNGVTLGGLRVTSGNTAMNLYGVSGITFPATQIASADANTLDDYEEGTWTPTLTVGTCGTSGCIYTKIGRLVTVSGFLNNFSNTSSGNQIILNGLPFADGSAQGNGISNGQSMMYRYVNYPVALYTSPGSTGLSWYSSNSGAYISVQYNHINSSAFECYFSFTYITN